MVDSVLAKIGLNEKEIIVYKELLLIGTSLASTIGKRTNINKSTVRYLCIQLEKKGLIFSIKKENTILYSAEDPSRLLSMIEKEKRELKEKENSLKNAIENLNQMKNDKVKLPTVTFYEGTKGLETMYGKILDMRRDIYAIENIGDMYNFIPDCVDNFIHERKNRNIHTYVVHPTGSPEKLIEEDGSRTVKLIDEKELDFNGDIKICGDTVNIMTFSVNNAVAISIKDEDVAKNFKGIFKYLWSK